MKSRRSARRDKALFYEIFPSSLQGSATDGNNYDEQYVSINEKRAFFGGKKRGKGVGHWRALGGVRWSFSCFKCYSKKVKHLMV